MNITSEVGNDTDEAAAKHISGANLATLLDVDETSHLSAVVGEDRAGLVMDWLRETIYHGHDLIDAHTGKPELDPWLCDVPVIKVSHIAEVLADHGVDVPTREQVREFAASSGITDPEIELMRAHDLTDPDVSAAAVSDTERRINGVPESIYKGLPDPAKKLVREGKVIASPQAPAAVARWLLRHRFAAPRTITGKGRRRNRVWVPLVNVIDGAWYRYVAAPGDPDPRWRPVAGRTGMRALLRHHLENMYYLKGRTKDGEVVYDVIKGWTSDTKTLGEVEAALADLLTSRNIGGTGTTARELPDIYGDRRQVYKGRTNLVLVRNGVLDLDTGALAKASPLWFDLVRIEARYDHKIAPDGPEIAGSRWMAVLLAQWWDDPGAVACLQEWFGYVVSGDVDLQRLMWLYGPQGSAKSLITAVLKALVGSGHVSLSLEALNDRWGLAEAYRSGATLGLISDSRFAARDSSRATNRVLNITSGIDPVEIETKYLPTVTAVLPIRLHGTSNGLPNLSDHIGALANRMLLLKTTREFRGTDDDDPRLLDKILDEELGLVLRWAVAGLARLRANGGVFTLSKHAAEYGAELRNAVSNVAQFLDECVELGENTCQSRGRARHRDCACDWVPEVDLYHVWDKWAAKNATGTRMSKIKLREALSDTTGGTVRYGQVADAADGQARRLYGIKSAAVTYYKPDKFGVEYPHTVVANRDGEAEAGPEYPARVSR